MPHYASIEELESEMEALTARRSDLAETLQRFDSVDHVGEHAVSSAKKHLGWCMSCVNELSELLTRKHRLISAMSSVDFRRHDELLEVNESIELLRFRVDSGKRRDKFHLEALAYEAPGAQHDTTRRRTKRGIPIAFAVAGAITGILVGIPSFTVDRGTRSKPPFFDVYCTEVSYLAGACRVSPGGILLMAFLGALILGAVGFVIALLLRSRKT